MDAKSLGNRTLLQKRLTAFFASRTVQTDRVLACYDWATGLSADQDCVISGFQSPVEKDVLHFLLKKRIPVVVVLARSLYRVIPVEYKVALEEGRLLFISINENPRNSNQTGKARNEYIATLASKAVFGMLTSTSSLYKIYQRLEADGKEIEII